MKLLYIYTYLYIYNKSIIPVHLIIVLYAVNANKTHNTIGLRPSSKTLSSVYIPVEVHGGLILIE